MIFGVTGQNGAFLARFLLDEGYIVHGIKRRSSSFNTQRVYGLYQDPHDADTSFFLHYGDLTAMAEVDLLLGAPNKANMRLGWHRKVRFPELVKERAADDLALLKREGWRCTLNE